MFQDTRSLSVALGGLPNLYAIIRARAVSQRYSNSPRDRGFEGAGAPPLLRRVPRSGAAAPLRSLRSLRGAALGPCHFQYPLTHKVALGGLPNLYAIICARAVSQRYRVALTTSTPLVRRPVAPDVRGAREAHPRFAFPQSTREIRVVPCLMRGFGKVPDHNGEGSAL